jgi:hypothetical protein
MRPPVLEHEVDPVGMHATSLGMPLEVVLESARLDEAPNVESVKPFSAPRALEMASSAPPYFVMTLFVERRGAARAGAPAPTAYRRVTCSLQLLSPPPARWQWPVPLPPAPPPRGDPHPPLPIQTPVFFGFFVRCSVTALERITLRGFCSLPQAGRRDCWLCQ